MLLTTQLAFSLITATSVVLGSLEPDRIQTRRQHLRRRQVQASVPETCADEEIDIYPSKNKTRFSYGENTVRGVNLGGWLVLEPWITPSLFDNTGNDKIVDEYTFGQYQTKDTALETLKKHWDTWITEKDFEDIAAAGLNHVRIPIGYWAFDVSGGEPYIQGQYPYLFKAIEWAEKHGVKVMIDLHGAPGSQNGFDNSGRIGNTTWHLNPKNVQRTNAVINQLALEFSHDKYNKTVVSIAPLNEPHGYRGGGILDVIKQYWLDSYQSIRYPSGDHEHPSGVTVILHNAFTPLNYWDGFLTKPNATGVAIDHHYEVFSDQENRRSFDQHIESVCSYGKDSVSPYEDKNMPVVTGEWSLALTDCAKYLNGRGIGARYDGTYPESSKIGSCEDKTGSGDKFTPEYKDQLRKFWEAQVDSYEEYGSGWIFWTWKNEGAAEWSYDAGIKGGWIPANPTERKYPNACQK